MIVFNNLGKMGRLGNQMFSILGTISIATRSRQEFGFPKWINTDGLRFQPDIDGDVFNHFVNPLPGIPEGMSFSEYPYIWGYQDLYLPQNDWNLNSHFQCPKYMDNCADIVRHYFTMKDEVDQNSAAVHMRFGDYDDNFHPRPDILYYSTAIGKLPFGGNILLFSDDNQKAVEMMEKLKPQLRFGNLWYHVVESDYLDSFKKMKRCQHFICANSSYSLMAAILAPNPDKIIVCPKKWFGSAWGPGQNEVMTQDLYPQNAIVI